MILRWRRFETNSRGGSPALVHSPSSASTRNGLMSPVLSMLVPQCAEQHQFGYDNECRRGNEPSTPPTGQSGPFSSIRRASSSTITIATSYNDTDQGESDGRQHQYIDYPQQDLRGPLFECLEALLAAPWRYRPGITPFLGSQLHFALKPRAYRRQS